MNDREAATQDKEGIGASLLGHLAQVRDLRLKRAGDPQADSHLCLKTWQSERLARTYADLLGHPRYRPAAEFFLTELYGVKDFTARDAEIERVVPTLVHLLPARALSTLSEAMRMDLLSESLDADMVAQLRRLGRADKIDDRAYADAYRACGRRAEREEQIVLVEDIGRSLERLTRMSMLGTTLKLMKRPAELAGLANLQRFLQHGFEAFRHMGDASFFLETIVTRETELMQRLLDER
jgi:hypothetical protein